MTDQLGPTDPQEIGPYRLTGRLGGGGMGEVFLGKSAGGRLVAVKVIKDELAADPEFRTRFRREVAAARRVSGLYTAMVAGADTEGPRPWLATAYVPGPSLAAAVDGFDPLPARSVLALAAGLAEGLDAVHAVGLVHRDVKPSNVLLAADGPRLIDFGIAWEAQSTVLTAAGTLFGSPEFMSPECATGQRFGPPTDVFSLGAVLVYAATGRPPFEGSSLATLVGRIVHEEPDLSAVPTQVRPIAVWCLAKDPAARPTPKELVARLGDAGLWEHWLPGPLLATLTPSRSPDPGSRRDLKRDTKTIEVSASGPPASGSPAAVDLSRPPATPGSPEKPGQAGTPEQAGTRGQAGTPGAPVSVRPAIRRATLIGVPAVLAAAGAGLWLGLGHQAGALKPTPARSATPPATGTAAATSPPARPAAAAAAPYRFALAGEVERACSAAFRSSGGGRADSVVFADKTKATTVRVYWVDYQGKKQLFMTLKPGASGRIGGDRGDVWQVDGPVGCVADFTTAASATAVGRVTAENAAT